VRTAGHLGACRLTSAELGGLCGRDTQAMLADAHHHHCTKDVVVMEGYPHELA